MSDTGTHWCSIRDQSVQFVICGAAKNSQAPRWQKCLDEGQVPLVIFVDQAHVWLWSLQRHVEDFRTIREPASRLEIVPYNLVETKILRYPKPRKPTLETFLKASQTLFLIFEKSSNQRALPDDRQSRFFSTEVHQKTTHPYYKEVVDNPLAPREAGKSLKLFDEASVEGAYLLFFYVYIKCVLSMFSKDTPKPKRLYQ